MKLWRKEDRCTIAHYLKQYGGLLFSEYPMNEVDSLILCQFSYLKFDGLVPGIREYAPSVSLWELAQDTHWEKLFADILFETENRALYAGMLSCRRFRDLRMNCYVNRIDKEWETQFAAITYLLEDGAIYIAFRGTDETFIGWKENFNMSFLSPIPGQELAVRYLNEVAGQFSNPFYVGGHSKGGNLAVYSAMHCAPAIQRRIRRIYNMDGPGFRPEILRDDSYRAIRDRVVKYLPQSSVIGMLFAEDADCHVIASRSFGLAQHNPFHWKIRNGHFVAAGCIGASVRRTDALLNAWIFSLDEAQARLVVETLYQVVLAAQKDDLISMASDFGHFAGCVLTALRRMDVTQKEVLRETFTDLLGQLRPRRRQGLPGRGGNER